MDTWSTDSAKEHERFAYWREIVCKAVFNISSEAANPNFSARLTARTVGRLRFAVGETSSCEIARSERDINSAPAEHYTLYLQRRGQTSMTQCDESFSFQCGDMFISDSRQPFQAALSDDSVRALAIVPRAMLDWCAPWLRHRPLSKINPNSQFIDLARRHFVHLVSDGMTDTEMNVLTDNLCNLVALASASDIETNRMRPELQIQAMVTFCKQNLYRSKLSPKMVAESCGVSVRTLHARFATLGQTFGDWLLATRLKACGTALRDPSRRNNNISEIAYSHGFKDLSHFNKTFRARFDVSPGEWRHGGEKLQ